MDTAPSSTLDVLSSVNPMTSEFRPDTSISCRYIVLRACSKWGSSITFHWLLRVAYCTAHMRTRRLRRKDLRVRYAQYRWSVLAWFHDRRLLSYLGPSADKIPSAPTHASWIYFTASPEPHASAVSYRGIAVGLAEPYRLPSLFRKRRLKATSPQLCPVNLSFSAGGSAAQRGDGRGGLGCSIGSFRFGSLPVRCNISGLEVIK
jgi:hypothetical protein